MINFQLRPLSLANRALLAGAISLSSSAVMASGLQVSPISLSLQARENASGLTLSNSGNDKVQAQVRVFEWSQDASGDKLTPSRSLLASPPMIQLNPNDKQLIRIIRAKAPPQGAGAVEAAYRVMVNELPIKSADQKTGLQFALSYSLPVFVQPVGVTKTSPQLQWHAQLQPNGNELKLRVSNSGNGHAQLAGLSFTDKSGNSTDINPGLLGYVLPGATMNWTLKVPPSALTAGGTFKVMMNGTQTTPNVTMDASTR
ncbi:MULTISPECIES: molecular chaperone [unclassified Psychrobacter]|uniref:fimbrial biogenesis chaperone n=1 Tax=unclassified Psychrobacter TaxID=196806 RepID=UPI0025CFBF3F|nr:MULTISPECIES: molecular chaperone [unclassified Psychrobacter]